ncbi:hypothetical protein [Roseovarius sp. SYSU LYC5161]|uniref:hypothetical protein n=1 Tax=Roseovarius halophilus (ex Wu et al. 2025) TaxID=3376060 RepID=UPI00399C2563
MEKLNLRHVEAVADVLSALGGAAFVRYRLDLSKSNTSNWRRDNKIPARHYQNIHRLVDEHAERTGETISVPDHLFNFDAMPAEQQAEAAE